MAHSLSKRPLEKTMSKLDLEALVSLLQRDGVDAYAGIGSRKTPRSVQFDMTLIARALEKLGFTLRSGGADGADLAFERGVSDPAMKEIFLPWAGFNGSHSKLYHQTEEQAAASMELASKHHPAWPMLVARANGDDPVLARKARAAMKLHARNGSQILGADLDSPVRFVVCWTEDGGASGGTGQAIRLAESLGIPVLSLHDADVRALLLSVAEDAARAAPAQRRRPRSPMRSGRTR